VLLWQIGLRLQPPAGSVVIPIAATLVLRALVYTPLPVEFHIMSLIGALPWVVVLAASVWRSRRDPAAARTGASRPIHLWVSAWLLPVVISLFLRLLVQGVRLG
jgi:hypothetical protein